MTVDYIGEPYEDPAAMADDSDTVVAGRVTDVASLGRPNTEDDVEADEYVAVTVDVESVLAGDDVDSVVIGWLAYGTDAEGNRVSEIVQNGVRVPRKGDGMLLFLVDADPRTARQLGGEPTHAPTRLDGVAFLDESKRVVELGASSVAGELDGRNVDQIRTEFAD